MNPTVVPTEQKSNRETTRSLRFIVGFFRWTGAAIFTFGLVFVIVPSLMREGAVFPLVAFLLGWIFLFTLIFSALSLNRPSKPRSGMVFVYNFVPSKFFGSVLIAIAATVGWFVFVEPLLSGLHTFSSLSLIGLGIVFLFMVMGAAMVLQVKTIRLDAGSRQYVYRNGYFPFCKEEHGDFTDFAALRIKREVGNTSEDGSPLYCWRLKLSWKAAGREELQLEQRPRGIADLPIDPVEELTMIGMDLSAKTGIPLEKPATDVPSP